MSLDHTYMSVGQSLRGKDFGRADITSAPKNFGAAWEYIPLYLSGEAQDSLHLGQPKAKASGTRGVYSLGGQQFGPGFLDKVSKRLKSKENH